MNFNICTDNTGIWKLHKDEQIVVLLCDLSDTKQSKEIECEERYFLAVEANSPVLVYQRFGGPNQASNKFVALLFDAENWEQYFPPKHQQTSTKLHGLTP
jgi:hypothetical protein